MNITLIKPIRILAVLLLYFTFSPLSAISGSTLTDVSTKRTIHVATAGTLPNYISESEKYVIEELTLTGELNGTDFRLLRDMAGCNYLGEMTQGKLKVLDLTNAKIVAGGEKYLDTDWVKTPTGSQSGGHYDIQADIISRCLFISCTSLSTIILPKIVNSIDESAFSFSGLTSIDIPNSVTSIKWLTFYGCTGLTSVTIPNSVTIIENSAFYGCSGLTSITIPNSVTSIGVNAFEGCSSLGSITIPNSVISINSSAFSGCNSLTSIYIPKSVANIGDDAFGHCGSLLSIDVDKENNNYTSKDGALFNKNMTTIVQFPAGTTIEAYDIPNSITSIGNSAFAGCIRLKSIYIPNSVTSIGKSAFIRCSNLTSLSIPDNVNNIESSAFYGCSGLTSLILPDGLKSVNNMLFQYCSGLISIYIPNSVTSIGDQAFLECSSLTSISIPNSVMSIGRSAFNGCSSLTTLTIPNSVKSIDEDAFASCEQLASVSLGRGLTNIAYRTFAWCKSLTTVTIPNSVTFIDRCAFMGCSGLKDVISEIKTPFEISEDVFSVYSTATLTVPQGTKSAYLSTVGWNKFENIVEGQSEINQEDTRLPAGYTAVEYIQAPKERYSTSQVWTVPTNLQENYNYIFEFTPLSWEDSYYGHMIGGNDISTTFPKCGVFKLDNGWGGMEKRFLSAFWNYDLGTNRTSPGGNYRVYTGVRSKFQMHCKNYDSTKGAEIIVDNEGYATYTHTSTTTYKSGYSVQAGVYDIPLFTTIDGNTEPPALMQLHNFKVEDKNGNAIYDYVPCIRDNDSKVGLYDIVNGVFYYPSAFTLTAGPKINNTGSQPTTIALNIKATGNGSASYNGTTIRDNTSTFEVEEGTSVTITFTPDNGYRIKSVKVGSTDVTSNVSNNTYTISSISGNTSVEVVFEAIPLTTYTLSIKATGNGSASYDGTTIKNQTSTFTVTEGTSATITFTPDNGYRIKSVKVGSTDITSSVSNNSYTISSISGNTSVEVEFEAIPPTTYTLSIKATGNGSASYDGTTIKNQTSTFTVTEGSDLTISFTPDNGYQIKSVVVDGNDVTSYVYNDEYTIGGINSDTTVEVEFEAIPPTTYTLSIKATGNGSATYDGTTIRGKTSTFTVNEGISATITFSSDNGYRIKSVKVNNSDVISSISNNSYTINSINRDTEIEVEFEAIPTVTYSLSITATGNGSASYEGTVVKNKTTSFTVNEGANATITFTPDNGYRIKSVKVNNTDVTSSVSNNNYTISNINRNTTVEVEFEVIPPTVYTLSIKATGNGSVTYDGTTVRGKTSSFNVNGGTSVTITINPDDGNRIKSVTVNSSDVISRVMNNSYTISNIAGNTAVEVVFEEIISELTNEGVYYKVVSEAQQTVKVVNGDYGISLDVPASFTAKNKEWNVVDIEADVLSNPELAAIIWNPEVVLNGTVTNPNLLLYVKDMKYAPNDINNVIVNGVAENIMLQDAESDNNFYCPQEFTAKRISFIHRYNMKTGFKTCQGWETIVLPFNVTTILSATGTEIVPYTLWKQGGNSRPFWLYSMNSDGWKAESGIKANIPYIISMPNNDEYDASYNLSGDIQFMSSNVQVMSSENLSASKCGNKQLEPNYQNKVASQDIYALNVNNQWNTNTATETEGSAFIRSLRQVRPFEAYMTIEGGAGARRVIPIFEDDTNGIQTIPWSIDRSDDTIYNLNGQQLNSKPRGVYIQNGKKIIK